VEVPEWEGSVYLKKLTIGDTLSFVRFNQDNPSTSGHFLLALTLCGADGSPLFSFDELSAMPMSSALITLVNKTVEINTDLSLNAAVKNS
jgi:hypothetical protein